VDKSFGSGHIEELGKYRSIVKIVNGGFSDVPNTSLLKKSIQ
jgi:hypothetical protein